MPDTKEKLSTGPNESPVNETIAGTGPGIPDEALGPGEELPEAPSPDDEERIRRAIGADRSPQPPKAKEDSEFTEESLPLEGQ